MLALGEQALRRGQEVIAAGIRDLLASWIATEQEPIVADTNDGD